MPSYIAVSANVSVITVEKVQAIGGNNNSAASFDFDLQKKQIDYHRRIRMFRSLSLSTRTLQRFSRSFSSTATEVNVKTFNLFNPTEEHASLREMLRSFVENEVDPQAKEFNRNEKFNVELFRKLGNLGLLGITVETEFGGSGMDATAAVIAHGKTPFVFFSYWVLLW